MSRPSETTPEAIAAEIAAAFDGVCLEDGITLHQARAMDDYEPDDDARLKDTEIRWQDVPEAKLRAFDDVHPFLCAKGFRFYIPAFLVWMIRHLDDQPPSEDSQLTHGTMCSLNPRSQHYRERFVLLSREQSRVVCRFLHYLSRHGDEYDRGTAEKYLEAHWGQFCPGEESQDGGQRQRHN